MAEGESLAARRSAVPWWIAGLSLALVAVLLIRTAWLSDDAYITLRTIDNFVNGYGLRWNVAERVQSFTHPAWLLLIAPFYAVTHEAYYTVLTLQILLTLGTVWLLVRGLARSTAEAGVAVALLVSSKAFIDFSTAGLENPLVHLLLVLLVLEPRAFKMEPRVFKMEPRVFRPGVALGILTSLILLCRLDLGLLIAPVLITRLRPISRQRVVSFAIGLVPFVLWEMFSLMYYGQLVPNTALAKLPPGVPMSSLAQQGLWYFEASVMFDPITAAVIVTSVAFLLVRGTATTRAIAWGASLQLVYLVCIGGDFMAGRFLTPIFVMVVVGRMLALPTPSPAMPWVVVGLFAAGFANADGPLRTGRDFGAGQPAVLRRGVVDERKVYYQDLGLLRVVTGDTHPSLHPAAVFGMRLRAEGVPREASSVGVVGYYAGPGVHLIDRNALSDPLLARLPPKPGWRIGHFLREVPAGYVDSCRENKNLIENSNIRDLYGAVRVVTRDPLFSLERLRAIWWLHMRGE